MNNGMKVWKADAEKLSGYLDGVLRQEGFVYDTADHIVGSIVDRVIRDRPDMSESQVIESLASYYSPGEDGTHFRGEFRRLFGATFVAEVAIESSRASEKAEYKVAVRRILTLHKKDVASLEELAYRYALHRPRTGKSFDEFLEEE